MACPTCDKMARTQLTGDGQPMMHDCPECKTKMVPMTPSSGPSGPTGGSQAN